MVINQEQKNAIKDLAEKYGLDMVLLFGSQATGETDAQSDIDIAYSSRAGLDLRGESAFIVDLMEVFKRQDIDLANLAQSSPLFKKRVADKSVVLYERTPSLFNEFYLYAARVYEDNKRLIDVRKSYIAYRLAAAARVH